MAYIDALMIEQTDYKNIIIDTVDLLWDYCSDEVCKQNGVSILKDIGFGDGWTFVAKNLRDSLIRLTTKYGLVCLSHAKEKKMEKVSEKQFKSVDFTHPSCSGRCAEVLSKWCDLTGYYYIDPEGERNLRIRPSGDIEAGNRVKGCFQYTDGSVITDIPMGNSEEEAYKNFVDAFNNRLVNPKAAPKKSILLKK
jgi:hypothetical protein